jgi:probable metal-binding protein
MSEIHAHAVLNDLIDTKFTGSRDDLLQRIEGRFGAAASFCACSAEGMSVQQLVDFLVAREKLVVSEGGTYALNISEVCDH